MYTLFVFTYEAPNFKGVDYVNIRHIDKTDDEVWQELLGKLKVLEDEGYTISDLRYSNDVDHKLVSLPYTKQVSP